MITRLERPRAAIFAADDPKVIRTIAEAEHALRLALVELSNEDSLRAALREWVTVPPTGDFVIGHGRLVSPPTGADAAALFLVWDSAEPVEARWPYKAYLMRTPGQGWSVQWLLTQCTSCFGVGFTEDSGPEICGTCGGSGWGHLESAEFSYFPTAATIAR